MLKNTMDKWGFQTTSGPNNLCCGLWVLFVDEKYGQDNSCQGVVCVLLPMVALIMVGYFPLIHVVHISLYLYSQFVKKNYSRYP